MDRSLGQTNDSTHTKRGIPHTHVETDKFIARMHREPVSSRRVLDYQTPSMLRLASWSCVLDGMVSLRTRGPTPVPVCKKLPV